MCFAISCVLRRNSRRKRVTPSVRCAIGTLLHTDVLGEKRNGSATILDRYEDEFHELNYYNAHGASSRELYESQHSRIVPLASRLLGLSFPPPSPSRVRAAPAQDTSPSSIHYARTNAVFIQRSLRRIHVSRPHLRDTKPTGIVLYGDII